MNEIKTVTATEEIQYRLKRLNGIRHLLENKNIVIYGTGINTKRVLDCLAGLTILGLMDANKTGQFIYEKKVLSESEVQLLKTDIILIAAEPESAQIIYNRIYSFCIDHNITIMDMYGCDEVNLHRKIKLQELEYASLTAEALQKKFENYKTIFVSFHQALCTELLSEEELFDIIESKIKKMGIEITDFKRNRMQAQKRLPFGMHYNLKDIYTIMSTIIMTNEKDITRIIEIEKETVLEYLRPRKRMIELIKYVQDKGVNVFICSDVLGGDEIVKFFLKSNGIHDCNIISTDHGSLQTLIGRTIYAVCKETERENVLFIGSNKNNNLILPQLYGVDIQLIEDSMTMFWNYGHFNHCRTEIERRTEFPYILDIIEKEYNSPFLADAAVERCIEEISEIIGWQGEEFGDNDLELLPPINPGKEIIKTLAFRESTNPIVSIIIPVYNQFSYTYNCLKSILMNSGDVLYEIILADDCSDDWTASIENYVSGIRVIHNRETLMFIRNCNGAAQYARGKYLLFLNNDTQVQLNWLAPLLRIFEQYEDAGLVGAKLLFPDGKLQEAGGIIWNDASGWNYGRGKNPESSEFNYVREVDYVSGAAIMIPKILWDEIGGFDVRYVPAYYEDADLAFEVRKHGKRVFYQPESEVVHFEGISNGTDASVGIKKYQAENRIKMYQKWKEILLKEQLPAGTNVLSACDRKRDRKIILFVSETIPTYDKDAGSRTLDFYIIEFMKRGFIVKFIPNSFVAEEPYAHRLRQMGVEVIAGKYFEHNILNWIYNYHTEIDYAFLNYPDASSVYIDVLRELKIPVRYYGVDLHYLRNRREYELFGNEEHLKASKCYYDKEAYLIGKSDVVYYPSEVEVEIVKHEFHKEKVRQLMINIYDTENIRNNYIPAERDGIMFIGGYRHAPNVDAVLWFVNSIFPYIHEKIKIPFYVAGVGMPAEIQNIKTPGVIVLGALTDSELEEMYNKVRLIVVPLRYGAGIKGKIIEAMYYGVPVVTTTVGAEGIPNEENSLIVEDDEYDYSQKLCEVYEDYERLIRISKVYEGVIAKYYSRDAAWNHIRVDFQ